MFCKECGKPLKEDVNFCKECGTSQTINVQQSEINDTESENHFTDENDNKEQISAIKKFKLFHSREEKLVDVLGSGFLASAFVQEKFKKSVLICSDKRIYKKGKLIERSNRGITYYHGQESVDVLEVTGMKYQVGSSAGKLTLAGIIFLLSVIGLFASNELRSDEIGAISGLFLVFSFIFFIYHSLKKRKYFIIQYAGGEITTPCNWYSNKKIKKFMKSVSTQKDFLRKQNIR